MGRSRRQRRITRLLVPAALVIGMLSALGVRAANASLLPPVLTSILVSPSTASLYQGQAQQFTATGLLSDGTLQALTNGVGGVTWSASKPSSIGSISPSGLVNALSAGTESITATAPSGLLGLLAPLTGTAILTVFPIVDTIAVSPALASISPGQTQQFSATGLLSDGTTQDVTSLLNWSSLSGSLASVSSTGLATGLLPGIDTITATAPAGLTSGPLGGLLSAVTGTASLTVLNSPAPPVPSLTTTPTSGKKRTVVTATGTNYAPGSAVIVSYLSGLKAKNRATSVLCSAIVTANGSFSCTGLIPSGSRAGRLGKHTVTAVVPSGPTTSTIFDLLRGVIRHR